MASRKEQSASQTPSFVSAVLVTVSVAAGFEFAVDPLFDDSVFAVSFAGFGSAFSDEKTVFKNEPAPSDPAIDGAAANPKAAAAKITTIKL
ncbi:MAG: hypothetical protein JSS81_12475 [Acidobacteria bacterium]|nr:hypothetical protein [Acidobacteriota bacterium]